ncbi:MAG: tRNA(His) guanylyltransferase Thg1 family protein [Capsulimonas sp.]|uniref:tRNA(His) guanylyltransferase Thg1 family protein n=1 Tax=Capsulimonas sp. TaxID=2494211 RepID=UPI00326726CD
MSKDSLGDRMKGYYENRTRVYLPRRTYTILRIDGKSFHTYTRDCERPFDVNLMEDMDQTAMALCKGIEGAQFAYVQSDEISILVTDFGQLQTQAWFDGNVQKLVSISASMAAAHFNAARWRRLAAKGESNSLDGAPIAFFDSRAFTIPDPVEVANYFIWRGQDATRNSISMTAHAHFEHDLLQGKTSDEMQELLWMHKGINWNDMPGGFKRGRCIVNNHTVGDVAFTDKRTGDMHLALNVERNVWEIEIPPIFSQDRNWLEGHIPKHSGN